MRIALVPTEAISCQADPHSSLVRTWLTTEAAGGKLLTQYLQKKGQTHPEY